VRDFGSGDLRLVAHVVIGAEAAFVEADLRRRLRQWLPDYMVPAHFARHERLPLTAHGKLDRAALTVPEELAAPVVLDERTATAWPEQELAAIWQDVLQVPVTRTDVRFDDLGGDSLLAMKVAARVRSSLGVDLPACSVLGPVNVADLASAVRAQARQQLASGFPPLRRVARDADIPASYAQQSVRFLEALHRDVVAYRFAGLWWIDGPLDGGALERSLAALVRRHEIYRTTFPWVDGAVVQRVHEPFDVPLARVDLSGRPAAAETALAMAHDASAQPLDAERLPLARWTLVRLDAQRHALIQAESHLVHDGWSFNLLLAELRQCYDAIRAGRDAALAPPPFQFADFAAWQREWLAGEGAQRQRAYWSERLAGTDRQITLPIDRPHPPRMGFAGRVHRRNIEGTLARAAATFGRGQGCSAFMVAVAAFATLLHAQSGETDLNIGSGAANRRLREFEGVLGMFVNTVVLRLDPSGNPSFRELVRRVRQTCLDAYDNQDLPFEHVVAAVRPPRHLGRQPLFQVMLSFHDSPVGDFEFPGTRTPVQLGITRGAKADLNVIVVPGVDRHGLLLPPGERGDLLMIWEYNTGLFDEGTVVALAERYLRLLGVAVARPELALAELAAASDARLRGGRHSGAAPPGGG
jgi:acyl carrier protein